jgi:uncharacterized protein (DUF2267 family)
MTTHVFHEAETKANAWLREFSARLHPVDDRQALRALRAGLHALRDRLPASEVVDLGAQLPMLIRGLYYEGWTLTNDPTGIRTRDEWFDDVRRRLRDPRLDAEQVLRAVIEQLRPHVSTGELADIAATLPRPLLALWDAVMS